MTEFYNIEIKNLLLERNAKGRCYTSNLTINGDVKANYSIKASDMLLSMLPVNGKSYLPEQLKAYVGKLSLHYLLHNFKQTGEAPKLIWLKTDGFTKGEDYLLSKLGISDLNQLTNYDCVSAGGTDCPRGVTNPKEDCLPGIAECWAWAGPITKQ